MYLQISNLTFVLKNLVATYPFFRYDVPHENTNPQHPATPTPSLVFSSVPEREAVFDCVPCGANTTTISSASSIIPTIISFCAYLQESLSHERESAKTPPAAGLP
jgi:hypothetical protein